MKTYQMVMALALAGSAGLALFGDNAPVADIAEPVTRAAALNAPAPRAAKNADAAPAGVAILRLTPRAQLVGDAGDATFAAGEGVFMGQDWNPPPPASSAASNAPPPPPMAPPMPFQFIGKAVADGVWEVYLARGDKTYSVRNQSVIEGSYRVDKIAPPLMSLTYLPLNQQQQMNIGVLE